MNRYSLRLIAIVVIAAFAGGAASHLLLSRLGTGLRAAHAQDKPSVTGARIVSATAFKVVDAKGNERARFGLSEAGTGALIIFGKSGKPRIVANVTRRDQPVFALYSAAGQPRLSIGLSGGDDPGIALLDKAGKLRTVYAVSGQGPAIVVMDAKGKPRATMAYSNKTDAAGIELSDADGETIWSVPSTDHDDDDDDGGDDDK